MDVKKLKMYVLIFRIVIKIIIKECIVKKRIEGKWDKKIYLINFKEGKKRKYNK